MSPRILLRHWLGCSLAALALLALASCDSGRSPTEPMPPRPTPLNAMISVASTACDCVAGGMVTVRIDGAMRGDFACMTSRDFVVMPGRHTVEACHADGCWQTQSRQCRANETWRIRLGCG